MFLPMPWFLLCSWRTLYCIHTPHFLYSLIPWRPAGLGCWEWLCGKRSACCRRSGGEVLYGLCSGRPEVLACSSVVWQHRAQGPAFGSVSFQAKTQPRNDGSPSPLNLNGPSSPIRLLPGHRIFVLVQRKRHVVTQSGVWVKKALPTFVHIRV